MRRALILCVISLSALAAAPTYKGKKVTLAEDGVPIARLLQFLGDVSKLNIVLLDPPTTPTMNVKADAEPWDQLLDEAVAHAGLALRREGNVVVVGSAKRIAARAKTTFSGRRISLELKDADVRDAVELVARTLTLEAAVTAGKPVTQRLRNVTGDQAVALLLELAQSTATPRKPPAPVEGCAAPKTPLEKLRVTAVASGTAAPLAAVVDEKGKTWFVGRKDCLAAESVHVKAIVRDALTTDGAFDLLLDGGALAHDTPPTAVDALLAELDAPPPPGFAALITKKKNALRFVRDVLGFKEVDERRPRGSEARRWQTPDGLGARVDAAILGGAHAKADVLRPSAADGVSIEGSALLEAWVRQELGDRDGLRDALTALVAELESNFDSDLAVARITEESNTLTVVKGPPPPNATFIFGALKALKAAGGPQKDISALEARTRAVVAKYVGEK